MFEGFSSTLILFWGQFLLKKISVLLGGRQGILEFKVHGEISVLCTVGCVIQSEGFLKAYDFPHFKFQTF